MVIAEEYTDRDQLASLIARVGKRSIIDTALEISEGCKLHHIAKRAISAPLPPFSLFHLGREMRDDAYYNISGLGA